MLSGHTNTERTSEMTPDEKIQILTDALKRIANCEDAPNLTPSGVILEGLNCGVEDRCIQSEGYDAASFGYTEGTEAALIWATNEANSALDQIE